MKTRSYSVSALTAGVSLLVVVGCGGGGGGDDGTTPAADTTATEAETNNTTSTNNGTLTGPLSGPRLYQTGNTAVQGQQNNVGIGFSPPGFTYTTDTSANITGDGLPSNNLPDVVYDEKGRGIEVRVTASGVPYIIDYNDDDSIASITRTRPSGLISQIVFNYEDGKLVSKSTTDEDADGTVENIGEITYTYAANGALSSADAVYSTFGIPIAQTYEFKTDASGRVTETRIFDRDGEETDQYVMTYDANNNITKVDLFRLNTLFITWSYTYAASAEPTVNLFGFFAAINDAFVPEFDLQIF